MIPITLKNFCDELKTAYAVDCDGHIWSKDVLAINWLGKDTIWLRGGFHRSYTGEEDVMSFSIHNGCEKRLMVKSEDPVMYNPELDEYTLMHNHEIHEKTGEEDDEGFDIYRATGVWEKIPTKLIMLYRKNNIGKN